MHSHKSALVRTALAGFILLVLARIASGATNPTALETLGFVGQTSLAVFVPTILTSGSLSTTGWPTAQGQQAITATIDVSGS